MVAFIVFAMLFIFGMIVFYSSMVVAGLADEEMEREEEKLMEFLKGDK